MSAETESSGEIPGVTMRGFGLALGIVVLAMANFVAVLDTTIVNVAVPHIAGALAVSPNEGTWVITSYAVAEAVTVPLSGWLAGRFGAVRVFLVAIVFFSIFSACCGLSSSLSMLVVFRVLQGLAGGPLMPMSQTLLQRITPPRMASMALGLWMMTTILAPVAGPVIGGILSDTVGWQWNFYINVPVAIICTILAWRLFHTRETEITKNPIDFAGLALLVFWVGALQIMLDNGENEDWFASPLIVALSIVALLGFVVFLIWELTEEHPIVDLRVFRHRGFAVSAVGLSVTIGAFFSSVVLIPLWLQTNMGYTATWSGYLMAFQGMLGVVMAPVAAALVSRVDPRAMMSFGLLVASGTALVRITFASNITFGQMIWPQLLQGFGMPLFFVPLMTLGMASVKPEETASAAGLMNFLRTMSGAFATAVATAFWNRSTIENHSILSGLLNRPENALSQMQASGMTSDQSVRMLDNMVQDQSVMLATNHMFLIVGLIVAVTAAGMWLMPKPERTLDMSPAGH